MLSELWTTHRTGDRRRTFDAEVVKRFREDTDGGVLAFIGIALPVLLGVSGLALDASVWYAQKRSAQAIADAAAYATVKEIQRTGDETNAKAAAKENAVIYGLDESTGDVLTLNIPPKYGAYAGTAGYYEVIVERPAPVFLAGLLLSDDFNVAARAVSGLAGNATPPCILATDPNMQDAFKVNNGTVRSSGCKIQVNSDDDGALHVHKNGILEGDPINIVGDHIGDGTISSTPNVNMPAIEDPLADHSAPGFSGCDYNNVAFDSGSHTLSPGVYCGGIDLTGDAKVTMEPGTYIISGDGDDDDDDDGGAAFSVTGQASLTGSGVTTYFDGDSNLSINGQGDVDLSAPTSGYYAGMLFYSDPNADPAVEHMVTGNGNTRFDGVMYFPNAIAKINGNGQANADAKVSAVIARQLRFGGNGTLDFHIDDVAMLPPAMQYLTLVE